MTWYQFLSDRKLKSGEAKQFEYRKPLCMCGGSLLRVAERDGKWPYHWKPWGWHCNSCGSLWLEYT